MRKTGQNYFCYKFVQRGAILAIFFVVVLINDLHINQRKLLPPSFNRMVTLRSLILEIKRV